MKEYFDLSERFYIVFKAAIIMIIGLGSIIILNDISLKNINKRVINQNTALIGSIRNLDKKTEEDIIKVLKNNDLKNYNKGKDILNKYSYNNSLKLSDNKLFRDISHNNNISIFIFFIIFSTVILGIIARFSKFTYIEVSKLIFRSKNIVDGKFRDKEEEYKTKSDSFNKLNENFNLMEDRIKNDIRLLKEEKINLKNIINDISHQLKTPLTALIMYNDILKDHANMKKNEIDEFINISEEQLERMNWLTVMLLKYARVEGGVVNYKKEKFSINNTISEAITPLKIKAEEKKQTIKFENSEKNFYLNHDRKWMAEALSNIIKNGIEHTGIGGEIKISTFETPIFIEIDIEDNGEGIEKSKINKIFERFYKDENSLKPKSIGIGLSLSKSIIESHNGSISVFSNLGEGTKFKIIFMK